ncbi:nuclear transport factor 2 family protein [Nostoc sp. MG11]|uniref:nuclear transport factor 2 family protein n=1 Tax=Nostoc sp. MG11 TaxID=2721166 RepID=UPI001868F23E|nr:nuclear transport factor 2 family protein [Nostoc sp. MG11]
MKSAEILTLTQPIQEVERLEELRYQAMLNNDTATLERLLGEDLHSNAIADTKLSYVTFLKSGNVRYQQIERENVLLRVYGDTVVVTGRILITALIKSEISFIDNIFVNIWAKRKQGWQLVHWQSTLITR